MSRSSDTAASDQRSIVFLCTHLDPNSHTVQISISQAQALLRQYDSPNSATRHAHRGYIHWQCRRQNCGKHIFVAVDAFRKGLRDLEAGDGDGTIEWRNEDEGGESRGKRSVRGVLRWARESIRGVRT